MSQTLYRHYDAEDNLLYIGVSSRISTRIKEHSKHSSWWNDIVKITLEHFQTREEVLKAERKAIINEFPKYNIKHANKSISDVVNEVDYHNKSCELVTARLVSVPISATVGNWSYYLGIPESHIKMAIQDNELGYFYVGAGKVKRPRIMCTGWQIIDWLENKGLKKC